MPKPSRGVAIVTTFFKKYINLFSIIFNDAAALECGVINKC